MHSFALRTKLVDEVTLGFRAIKKFRWRTMTARKHDAASNRLEQSCSNFFWMPYKKSMSLLNCFSTTLKSNVIDSSRFFVDSAFTIFNWFRYFQQKIQVIQVKVNFWKTKSNATKREVSWFAIFLFLFEWNLIEILILSPNDKKKPNICKMCPPSPNKNHLETDD